MMLQLIDIAGLCEVCSSIDSHLMVFPAHKRGSLQLLVSDLVMSLIVGRFVPEIIVYSESPKPGFNHFILWSKTKFCD